MSASQPPALRPLGTVPTPLHRLEGLMREFPGGPELLIKREDLCRTAARGCKARKLVALMADAQSIPTTFILTTGSGQSNYCAMTAVAAAMYGMRTELHLAGRDPGPRTRHLCIAGLAGATVRFTGARPGSNAGSAMQARATEFRAAGEVPYVIPLGGSTPLGAAIFAAVVPELLTQLAPRAPTHPVTAAGSFGTMAGLILRTWVAGLDCQVHGYSVLWPEQEAMRRLERLLGTLAANTSPRPAPGRATASTDPSRTPAAASPPAPDNDRAGSPPTPTQPSSTPPAPPRPWQGSSRASPPTPTAAATGLCSTHRRARRPARRSWHHRPALPDTDTRRDGATAPPEEDNNGQ